MRPLLVDLETEWRGGQNQALLLLKGLRAQGHAAELIAVESSALAERARAAGATVHGVPARFSTLHAYREIRRIFREAVPEVIHANEPHALTAAWLADAHGLTAMVVSRRVGYPLSRSWLAKTRYRAARRIIANSHWVAGIVENCGIARKKITVIYEGVEILAVPSPAQRGRARARWGVSPETPLLGCAGVFLPDKGQEWLIQALAGLRPEFPNCRLLLAGDGPLRPKLEAHAHELGVADAVLFPGFVKDVENVYAALDVFLFPSFFEGLGTSLLAAMAHAVPSITFDRCAFGEIVENEKSGLLVETADVHEIQGAVARFLRDPEFARRIGEAGRERVQQNFSADGMVEKMITLYEELGATERGR